MSGSLRGRQEKADGRDGEVVERVTGRIVVASAAAEADAVAAAVAVLVAVAGRTDRDDCLARKRWRPTRSLDAKEWA